MTFLSHDLAWWITAFDLPAMAGLLLLIWRVRREAEDAIEQMRESLTDFRLEVAMTYASQAAMRELETRLTSHLLRIEAKLDVTALKAEAIGARTKEK